MRFTANEYDGENCDTTGLISLVRMVIASSGPSNGVAARTQAPSKSIPRRPARPAICNMLCVSSNSIPRSPRFAMLQMTVVRAGMLMPAARVSVAKTTFINSTRNKLSTNALCAGRMPAWCDPMPHRSCSTVASSNAISGFPVLNERTRKNTSCASPKLSKPISA